MMAADYAALLPVFAPEYLTEWAETREWNKNALLYKCAWVRDPITGLRERAAEVICTACGNEFYAPWSSDASRCPNGGYKTGFWLGTTKFSDGAECNCPECGAAVTTAHITGATEYARQHSWPMTLHRIPERGKADRLAMVKWEVQKSFDKLGKRHIWIHPWEAVIAEEKNLVKCTKHGGFMGGPVYFADWNQNKEFRETFGDVTTTVCPEGIGKATEGTTAENAKLEIYMAEGHICFPAAWLRIWQKHPNAETLMTCGAAEILRNIIGQEKLAEGWKTGYNAKIPQMKFLNWKEKRPCDILRMRGKDELREAVRLGQYGGGSWIALLNARKQGADWTLNALAALEQMDGPTRQCIGEIGETPQKVKRYLDAQRQKYPADKANITMLRDYRQMATAAGEDLTDPKKRWPERLKLWHDRMLLQKNVKISEALDRKIRKRYDNLSRWSFEADGLLIRPAASHKEFIQESEVLNHCVQSYAQRYGNGSTDLFWIRMSDAPEIPFFTLELDEKQMIVIQNRGNRNCARTPEVSVFEKRWLRWLRSGAKRDKDGRPIEPEALPAAGT